MKTKWVKREAGYKSGEKRGMRSSRWPQAALQVYYFSTNERTTHVQGKGITCYNSMSIWDGYNSVPRDSSTAMKMRAAGQVPRHDQCCAGVGYLNLTRVQMLGQVLAAHHLSLVCTEESRLPLPGYPCLKCHPGGAQQFLVTTAFCWRWAGPWDSCHCLGTSVLLRTGHCFCKRGGRRRRGARVEVALPCCWCIAAREPRHRLLGHLPLMREAAWCLVERTVNEAKCLTQGRYFFLELVFYFPCVSVLSSPDRRRRWLRFSGDLARGIHSKITTFQETYILMGQLPFRWFLSSNSF